VRVGDGVPVAVIVICGSNGVGVVRAWDGETIIGFSSMPGVSLSVGAFKHPVRINANMAILTTMLFFTAISPPRKPSTGTRIPLHCYLSLIL
jgi:hypothetical protein